MKNELLIINNYDVHVCTVLTICEQYIALSKKLYFRHFYA